MSNLEYVARSIFLSANGFVMQYILLQYVLFLPFSELSTVQIFTAFTHM